MVSTPTEPESCNEPETRKHARTRVESSHIYIVAGQGDSPVPWPSSQVYNYRNLPIKRPWALEIHRQKKGGGRLHGEAICTYNAYAQIGNLVSCSLALYAE